MCRVWKCGRVSCAAPCAALTEHTAQRVEESWSSWREARGLGSAGSESETAPDRTWTEVGALSRSLSFGSTCTLQQLRKAVSCIRLKMTQRPRPPLTRARYAPEPVRRSENARSENGNRNNSSTHPTSHARAAALRLCVSLLLGIMIYPPVNQYATHWKIHDTPTPSDIFEFLVSCTSASRHSTRREGEARDE
jgi:hypothetical protein